MSDPIFILGEGKPMSPRVIMQGLIYQGGAAEGMGICKSPELLADLKLKAVITVAHDIRIQVPATLVHLHVPVDEINPTPEKYFDMVCNLGVFPVYIHCMAGANRSRVFAAALAWKGFQIPLATALSLADPPRGGIVYESMMKWARKVGS